MANLTGDHLTHGAFLDGICGAIGYLNDPSIGTIDADLAWEAYKADPARFHRPNQDNPEGNPFAAIVLEDGPWWVAHTEDQ